MFETVVVESRRRPVRAAFLSGLPISAALHVLALGSATVIAVMNVSFPAHAPSQFSSYSLLAALPLPPPARAAAAAVRKTPVIKPRVQETKFAPVVVPEEIPVIVPEQAVIAVEPSGVIGGVEGGVDSGIAGGAVDGAAEGVADGVVHSVSAPVVPPPSNLMVVPLDEPLPMLAMSKVYPAYPERARLNAREGTVVVRYFIDVRGRVREVQLLRGAQDESFNKAAMSAIRQWRFRPFKQDGRAIEVMHELTVFFQLEQG